MKKTAIVLILGILTIASATCFGAFGGPPGPPPGPPPHGNHFFGGPPGPPPGPPPHGGILAGPSVGPPELIEKLALTDDQLKKMRMAYVDFQDRTRKARSALMALHDEKRTVLISGKIDQAKLTKWDEEITEASAEVMAARLKMERERLSILTPEQVDLLASVLSQGKMAHRPRMKGR